MYACRWKLKVLCLNMIYYTNLHLSLNIGASAILKVNTTRLYV